ncbi:MAG: hypothetical protein HYY63_01445 [Elusimicrobia bacterium]|nr:hypothetical protein [Elusimicrobiota bacterium]
MKKFKPKVIPASPRLRSGQVAGMTLGRFLYCLSLLLILHLGSREASATDLAPYFQGVTSSSLTVRWTSFSGIYNVTLSTSSNFIGSQNSSGSIPLIQNTSSYPNLTQNVTYYFHVKLSTESDVQYSSVSALLTSVRRWDGEGSDNLASNRLNWVDNVAPISTNSVQFVTEQGGTKACHWDLNIDLEGVYMGVGFSSSVVITGDRFSVSSNFYQNGGTFNAGNSSVTLKGNLAVTNAVFDTYRSTVTFSGSSPFQQVTLPSGASFYHLVTNNSQTVYLQSQTITINGNLTLTTGTFNTTGSTINFRGNAVTAGGIVYATNGKW